MTKKIYDFTRDLKEELGLAGMELDLETATRIAEALASRTYEEQAIRMDEIVADGAIDPRTSRLIQTVFILMGEML